MREKLPIGPAPAEEECAQVGDEDYEGRAWPQCRQFIKAIERKFGPPPEGARLKVVPNRHDFGVYFEVAVEYDPEDESALQYALAVEGGAPAEWSPEDREALGMSEP